MLSPIFFAKLPSSALSNLSFA
uniref:Uncharacterized protein n=1 Tax=Rhizophora mucronata TaxID=61149 RepID=A0A2P2JP03_RHIMU